MAFQLIKLCDPAVTGCEQHGPDCNAPGKVPLAGDWANRGEASRPDGNYGVLTGPASGVLVIDIDSTEAGAIVDDWRAAGLPDTYTVRSGRKNGGAHLYYTWPAALVRVPNRLDGVEIKGPGRQVVGPGSLHASGRRYEVVRDLPLAELPDWFVARLTEAAPQAGRKSRYDDATPEALAALDRFLEHFPEHREQSDGNFVACCPAHADHDPSLVVTASENRVLVFCRAGCTVAEVVEALGITLDHLYGAEIKSLADRRNARGTSGHPRTDAGNALRLVDLFGDDLRYVDAWKAWLNWDGRRWVRDRFGSAVEAAKATARAIMDEANAEADPDARSALAKWALASESASKIKAMVDLARSDPRVFVSPASLDSSPWLLNCENGTVNLRNGQLQAHDPADLLTRLVLAPYDPAATAPAWAEFLEQVLPGAETRAYMQRVAGMTLSGENPERVMFILHGDGRNGKTVIAETMQALLGDYAGPISKDAFIERRAGAIRNDLADARGRRLVISSETEDGEKLSVAEVKAITGGDSISVRRLYENQFAFRPEFKVWLLTNYLPRVTDPGVATWDRLRVIPFTVRIADSDVRPMAAMLGGFRAEAAGVLAWAVAGCLEWQRIGLAEPMDVVLAGAAWQNSEDVVGQFLSEATREPTAEEEGFIASAELYKAYQCWCVENGHRPMSLKRLSPMFQKRGMAACRSGGKDRRKGYCGRELTDEGHRLAAQDWTSNR